MSDATTPPPASSPAPAEPEAPRPAGGVIVVGVDGSEGSDVALHWAVVEARLRGALLRTVTAWTYPYVATVPGMLTPVFATDQAETDARSVLDAALERVLGDDPVGCEHEVVIDGGPPARALLDAAADADLLVVGTRGHGGFMGLLLGSVSQQCATHAPCPVVIVPAPEHHDEHPRHRRRHHHDDEAPAGAAPEG